MVLVKVRFERSVAWAAGPKLGAPKPRFGVLGFRVSGLSCWIISGLGFRGFRVG